MVFAGYSSFLHLGQIEVNLEFRLSPQLSVILRINRNYAL